jgi:hypothetical protein
MHEPTLPCESVAWILNVPEAVGVPVTAPVEVFRVRPAGSVPTTLNVYGGVPPLIVIAPLLKATPTVPVLFAPQVTVTPGLIVIVQAEPTGLPWLSMHPPTLPWESVAWILNVPEVVGVPVTAPVDVFSVRPRGRLPTTVNVYGAVPPVTVIAPLLKGTPTVPVLIAPQVTVTGALIVIEQVVPTLPLASVTLMLKVPAAVGVPVTAPVEVFSVRPAGSVPVATENV